MNNQLASAEKEAYHTLATLITAFSAGLGIWGITNLLEGCGNDNPAAREQGERQLKAAGNLVVLAAYVRERTLPDPQLLEWLAVR